YCSCQRWRISSLILTYKLSRSDVRFWGQSGHSPSRARRLLLTQCMVRPCVARGLRRVGGCAVLHQCIRPLIGAFELRAIMDISARAISLADRPERGHLGHQYSQAPERPILHLVFIVSQTSAGKMFRRLADHATWILLASNA